MRVKCAACLLLCYRAHPYEQALLLLQRCWYWTGNSTHVFAKDNAGADVKKGLHVQKHGRSCHIIEK